jgi:hypothetical protein
MGGQKVPSLLPATYMKNLIKEEFSKRKRFDVDDFSVLETTYLQSRRFNNQESRYTKRIVFAEVKYNEKSGDQQNWRYTCMIFDPYTAYEIDRLFMNEIPDGFKPRCGNCGSFADERIITPEELEIMKKMGMMKSR